jgi:drug/metabolite transporter (DMT)-like permease
VTRETRGTLAVFGSAAGYSSLPILGKLALAEGVRVLPMVAWRFLIASAALWLLIALGHRRLPARGRWLPLGALGVLYAVNATAYLAALQWVSASLASLVFFTYPAVVIVLAAVFLGEPLSRPRLLATVLAMSGCALIVGFDVEGGEPLGLLLILIAVAFVAVYILWGKSVLRDTPARGAAAVSLLATGIVMALVAAPLGGLALGGGARGAVLIGLMGLIATAAPVTLLLAGIRDIGPGQAAVYATVEPLLTVLWASLLLGERITTPQYAGGLVLLSGVLWLRLQRPPAGPPG